MIPDLAGWVLAGGMLAAGLWLGAGLRWACRGAAGRDGGGGETR